MGRTAVLYDARLPFDGMRPEFAHLEQLARNADLIDMDSSTDLFSERYDAIVYLHGRYMPECWWRPIRKHLEKGGGLVWLGGGTPFSVPVAFDNGSYKELQSTHVYNEQLYIHEAVPIDANGCNQLEVNPDYPLLEGYTHCFGDETYWSYTVQLTQSNDIPQELGTSGPMDATLQSLLFGVNERGNRIAAPAVIMEHPRGRYAGGQWFLIGQKLTSRFWEGNGNELIQYLAEHASSPVMDLLIRSSYASYYPGEKPILSIQGQQLQSKGTEVRLEIEVVKDSKVLEHQVLTLTLNSEIQYVTLPLDMQVSEGLYLFSARVYAGGRLIRTYRNGFWGYDKALLQMPAKLECGKDYFERGGKPVPIVGMTYMQSDVHRKFMFLPNVYLWNKEISELKDAGVTMLRTGVWTGFRHMMFQDGIPNEEALRAIDALFLTASLHDVPLVFTFFCFYPETWEGTNPYMDPRSIQAQKRFVASIVSRHAHSTGISWDLINEPTVGNPKSLWWPLPNRDRYEQTAWIHWLKERHGTLEQLRDRWKASIEVIHNWDSIPLPEAWAFDANSEKWGSMQVRMVYDYLLFTQYIMNRWISEMSQTIRSTGSTQLITVGQDEALMARRPSPFFYAEETDYTTNHPWGQNDDLMWNGYFAKTPNKPNLIQETGSLFNRNSDGSNRRPESVLRNILEHKYAAAFATGGAGAIQWVWNTNVYLNSVVEAHIGAVRADGTIKPEAEVTYDFGDFMHTVGSLFEEKAPESIAVVYPFASSFSVPETAITATKRLTRVLSHQLNQSFQAYGEFHIHDIGKEKLIILPSPTILTSEAWNVILNKASEGACVLMTGVYSLDDYRMRVPSRSGQLGLHTLPENISREEQLWLDGEAYRVSYGSNKVHWILKECLIDGSEHSLQMIPYGEGNFLWCPLPVELNDSEGAIEALYVKAMEIARVEPEFRWLEKPPGVTVRKLNFRKGSIYIAISESSRESDVSICDNKLGYSYRFYVPPGRIAMFALGLDGQVIKSYRNEKIETESI